MAGIIAGGKVTVKAWAMPPDAELLGMDGNQVWYGDEEGLGSTVARDISHCFVPGSFTLGSSDDEER